MKVGKPQSKRVPVRLRHKIEKKSAAKQRKAKKEAKQNPEWRSKLKKDPGIPNLFPYKDKILAEIEEKKRLKEEEQQRKREEAKARRAVKGKNAEVAEEEEDMDDVKDGEDMIDYEASDDDAMDEDNSSNPMAALLASAKARAAEYEAEHEDDVMEEDDDGWTATGEDKNSAATARKDSSRKAFDKIFKQVVEAADVVLYVLDARDPEGTRSKEVERQVMSAAADKRLILILNKIDLVPPPVLKGWLTHLRRYFPTLPLRASNPAPNAKTFDHKQLTVKATSEALFKALKSYAQSKQLKRSISVGVIGYPNVGKSSVINALTSRIGNRQAACPTGAEAGVTTSLREVKLDNKLKLLDSPGIVFPSSSAGSKAHKAEEQARLILLNAIPPKEIDDPIPAVSLLVKRMSQNEEMFNKLLAVYELPALMSSGDITNDFLIHVARKRGRLSRGGVPNLHSAALAVITDWRDGRIQGWMDAPILQVANVSMPNAPAPEAGAAPVGDQKEIVKEWAAEFKLDGLWGDGESTEAMES
ncbi:putative nuclear gtp-binding protein nug1 protein [Lasiodiplodia theobromae]|uniref:Nuclear GTP-binding protein NUG1 n=1 Tax=Lasiodiplodia theobromae TaxID=45133 RepID=A0A5N5DI18_9PEZI|nr:Nucleolar GTP-binding protein 2 [Lasiodiplodia theobromae]KAB2577485.1 Nuclear GTP-binding protein NUG1 [Lasiodiplodia theobromae]KAF4540473.1 Nucleolar GTP-binding protein 2 [Lasiodiplodia theobromae]KAF9640330.1 putative nuclear gtp-binding protein nug1 protein [Lasiodiplodia theobromae]